MRNPRTQGPHRRWRLALASGAAVSLLLPLLIETPAGAAGPGCASPPSVVADPSSVPVHTTGTGYTTIEGSTPTTFDVDVLGVIPDGITLGVDFIVVRLTGPQQFLDDTGGVFFGMSGSPVYIDGDKDTGDLLGALSYGWWNDPTLAGLTPAPAMLQMFDLPTIDHPSFSARIPITRSMQRTVVASGTDVSDSSGSFQEMPTVLSVPAQGRRLHQLRHMVRDMTNGVRVVGPAGASAGAPVVSGNDFGVGEPVSSIVSYGDASIWAAGTVSIVCPSDTNVIAMYGHPLFWNSPGPVTLGLNGVNVLTIAHSPAWWNDMVPVITDVRGSVTADRFVGEVGQVGLAPTTFPITSSFTSPDTGLSRNDAETDTVYQQDWFYQWETWLHMVLNLDAVFQRISSGSSNLSWTLSFEDADGNLYDITNRVHYYSNWDATDGIWKLISEIDQLQYSDFGPMTFTSLDATGSITATNDTGTITGVNTSSALQKALRSRHVIRVKAGHAVTVEVNQTPAAGGADVVTTFTLKVPHSWHGQHRVTVRGGEDRWWGGRGDDTLRELVKELNGGEHADDVIVQGIGRKASQTSPLIVTGRKRFTIDVV